MVSNVLAEFSLWLTMWDIQIFSQFIRLTWVIQIPWLYLCCFFFVCVVRVVFEEPEDPSNRSFFSEIISSISDVKFSHTGRYIMTRDYLTVKVWDLNMENRPIETYQVFYLYPLVPGMWMKGVGIEYSVWKCGCLHNIPKCFKTIYFYMYLFITAVRSWNWPTHNLPISVILLIQ